MYKNLDVVSETTSAQINAKNKARVQESAYRSHQTRSRIEDLLERKRLTKDAMDGLGLDYNAVKLCVNCGGQLKDKPPTAKFCRENCRKSYWKRNKK